MDQRSVRYWTGLYVPGCLPANLHHCPITHCPLWKMTVFGGKLCPILYTSKETNSDLYFYRNHPLCTVYSYTLNMSSATYTLQFYSLTFIL